MIISREREFIFIHLLKCGGSSIEQAYLPHMLWSDLLIGTTPIGIQLQDALEPRFGLSKHNTAGEARAIIGAKHWSACRRFALVRHPHAIYESLFRWTTKVMRRHAQGSFARRAYLRMLARQGHSRYPFMAWPGVKARLLSKDFPGFIDAVRAQERANSLPVLPTLFDCLTDGENLLVTDLFKVEEFEGLLTALQEYLGIDLAALHRNQGDAVPIAWTEEQLNYVSAKHAADFELFGYPRPERDALVGRSMADIGLDNRTAAQT